ncbi:protein FAM47E isoform X1 [Alligator mississippiensis]|uniref:protein FAM47E isoform X1 n=1 Tax=Alligator mississippiensis TaxID=8496 RepID=UPI002877AE43|nr:protein FAM47E isoform X1 [Alligator mississippiensis]
MPLKCIRENKLKFSDSLNSRRWTFLKNGLDDFRDGFPPPSDNNIIHGTKGPVPILQNNSASNASCMAQPKGRKRCTKTQISPCKLSPLQKARRDYISQIEYCVSQHPLVLYPHLEESVPPELFKEVMDVLDPEMCLSCEAGCKDHEQENHAPQKEQYLLEDGQRKKTTPVPRSSVLIFKRKEFRGKNSYTRLSKKEVAARERAARLNYIPPLDENIKQITKEFCDWVTSLGGEKYNMDEATILSMFDTGYETKPTISVPIHVVELNNVPAELRKCLGVSPPQTSAKSPLNAGCHPCYAKDPSQTKWEKIRYGAWYLDPKTWRKQKANETLEAPKAPVDSFQNMKMRLNGKEAEVIQLHGTYAFKEFLERKGYRKPEFLLKMLAATSATGTQEGSSKSHRKEHLKRHEGLREGSSSTIVN